VSDENLEEIRLNLAATTNLPDRSRLVRGDFVGALGVFVIIVLSTFPVALPFIIFRDVPTALLVSRFLTLVILFCCGLALGRHAGWSGWKAGLAMTAFGVLLTMAIIALGG
jgi:VIT1/CCC1 family predicted Fe2+/Mn2+ transporter